jgi:hypothetical protein
MIVYDRSNMTRPSYQFWTYDQTQFNWLTRVIDKDGDGYGFRMRFAALFCPRCGRFDHDKAFEIGWDGTFVKMRPRKGRNILVTDDDFLCVTNELLGTLTKAKVKGFEAKPLPNSGWSVLRITCRRRFEPEVYRSVPECSVCKGGGHYGSVQFERQIDVPDEDPTFFSTDKPRGQGGFDIFVSDGLRGILQEANASGGELHRLLTPEEESLANANPKWRAKHALVTLGGHRNTVTD